MKRFGLSWEAMQGQTDTFHTLAVSMAHCSPRPASDLHICCAQSGLAISNQPTSDSNPFIAASSGALLWDILSRAAGKEAREFLRRDAALKRVSVEAFTRWGDAAQPRWGLF